TINQGGVLRAPFGQITFGDTTNPAKTANINLLPGSITSVAADGLLIPYGSPMGALNYIYGFTTYQVPNQITAPVEKVISFYGKSVNVAGGATISEAGGGDLYGAQFVSGSGGAGGTFERAHTFVVLPA